MPKITKQESQTALAFYGALSGVDSMENLQKIMDKPKRKNNNHEGQLVRDIINALSYHGYAMRLNSGQVETKNGYMFRGCEVGTSDVLFLRNGKATWIEIKIKGNKATEAQVAFIERMKKQGCRGGVAYSVSDALDIAGIV